MVKKTVFSLLLIASGYAALAQTNSWKYDFGETEATFNPNPGASSTKFYQIRLILSANEPNGKVQVRQLPVNPKVRSL